MPTTRSGGPRAWIDLLASVIEAAGGRRRRTRWDAIRGPRSAGLIDWWCLRSRQVRPYCTSRQRRGSPRAGAGRDRLRRRPGTRNGGCGGGLTDPLAHDSGSAATQLVGDTMVPRWRSPSPRQPDGLALVSRHQGLRWTWEELAEEVERAALGLLGDRHRAGRPGRDLVAGRRRVDRACSSHLPGGAILVNVNPAYRQHELGYVLGQSGVRVLVTAESFKTSDYLAMVAQVRDDLPALERVVTIGTEGARPSDDLLRTTSSDSAPRRTRLLARGRPSSTRRPDQHPVHERDHRESQGRDPHASQHPQQRPSVAEVLGYTGRIACASPCRCTTASAWASASWAASTRGATMVYPAPSFEPRRRWRRSGGAVHEHLRGADDVHRELEHPQFDEFDLTSLRTGIMAGAPCPIEVMKRVIDEMHADEITIAYGMTETAPVSFMTRARRRHRPAGQRPSARRCPHVEVKIVDPVSGRTVPRRQPGEI